MAAAETLSVPLPDRTSPSLQELVGTSHSTPTWLDPERFLRPDFDPEVAVLDLRRYVSSVRLLLHVDHVASSPVMSAGALDYFAL